MARQDIDIINGALVRVRAGALADLAGADPKTVTVKALYPELRDYWLTVYRWTFCQRRAALQRDPAPPAAEWRYRFYLPADALDVPVSYHVSAAPGAALVKRFERGAGAILADEPQLWATYPFRMPERDWPPAFILFAKTALAAELAVPVAGDRRLAEKLAIEAWGRPPENRTGGLFHAAVMADQRGRPARSYLDDGDPITSVRWGGGDYG